MFLNVCVVCVLQLRKIMLSWSAHNKVNKTINKFIYLGENNFLKFSIDLPLQGILDL